MATFSLRARFARRIPDPIMKGSERHIFLCPIESVPEDLPMEKSNVRRQNINRRIYKEVAKHLRNENEEGEKNTFHLKNKGITILAENVIRVDEEEQSKKATPVEIVFANEFQGIVDGGHTYKIICQNKDVIAKLNKAVRADDSLTDEEKEKKLIRQYVKIEVLTGLNPVLTTEIARGLNTAVQVQEQTLANHGRKFDWIKEELADEPYLSKIAFRESEDGLLDVTDLLCILELFNISDYPNEGSARHPTRAYTGKENVLASYLRKKDGEVPGIKKFKRLRPLLKQILTFHDTVSYEARELWNKPGRRRAGGLSFVDGEDGRAFPFPFINTTADYRLFKGALFPLLAAFRWMVVRDRDTGLAKWRGSFDDVLELWRELAIPLLEATKETSKELGYKADAIGKSSNHWKNLYNVVAFHQMRAANRD